MTRRRSGVPAPGEATPRRRRRRIIESALVAIGCLVLGDSLIGERGLVAMARARSEARAQQQVYDRERAETVRLREERRRLETDWAAIEDLARRKLGLVKPGEKVFVIKDVPPASTR